MRTPFHPIGLGLILGLILASLIFPWVLITPLIAQYSFGPLMSQYVGMAALIVMAWIQILATRKRGLEHLFGPLDQIYRLHKWLGITALALVLLHDNLDPEIKALGRGTALNDLGEGMGEWALNGLLVLVTGSVLMLIPYRLWYLAHRFIGLFYALSAGHFLLIKKPFGNF